MRMNWKLTWDEPKRQATLHDRGLDFADAGEVFANMTQDIEDSRRDYGERRMLCFGVLRGRLILVGYVQRGQSRHIFSMRKANGRGQARFGQ